MNTAERINNGSSTCATGAVEIMQVVDKIASILTPDYVGLDCSAMESDSTLMKLSSLSRDSKPNSGVIRIWSALCVCIIKNTTGTHITTVLLKETHYVTDDILIGCENHTEGATAGNSFVKGVSSSWVDCLIRSRL
ncbi:hypothetical protein TNCV_3011341 [Trichonephila clavipes]|nr:hypothetical protein TNCV_3011341 [Trichonephila clavipes]